MDKNMRVSRRFALLGTVLSLWCAVPVLAEDGPGFTSSVALSFGSESIDGETYPTLGLLPDFGYGPLGIGLDLSFHYQFYKEPGGDFGFYPRAEDWWDSSLTLNQNLNKYLARVAYLRWGQKGQPLYVQAGLLPATTLGSGFLVGGYSNGGLRPATKLTGLALDVDGSLVGAPWAGVESFIGDLSTFDVLGLRAYVRPVQLLTPEPGTWKELQVGLTLATDTNPDATATGEDAVVVAGIDAIYPFYNSALLTARATVDGSLQGEAVGASVGVAGSLLGIFQWGLSNQFLGDGFLPGYFDQGYQANRGQKYQVYSGAIDVPGTVGWQVQLGANFLTDLLTFGAVVSGPWTPQTEVYAQPRLMSSLNLKEGVLPVALEAHYVKLGLQNLGDLVDPADAIVGAKVGYTMGSVTINIVYDAHYQPSDQTWVTTSRIETAVKMF